MMGHPTDWNCSFWPRGSVLALASGSLLKTVRTEALHVAAGSKRGRRVSTPPRISYEHRLVDSGFFVADLRQIFLIE